MSMKNKGNQNGCYNSYADEIRHISKYMTLVSQWKEGGSKPSPFSSPDSYQKCPWFSK